MSEMFFGYSYEEVAEALIEQGAFQGGQAAPPAGQQAGQAGAQAGQKPGQAGAQAAQAAKPRKVDDVGSIVLRFKDGQEMEISPKADPKVYQKWMQVLKQNQANL